jgi:hypothetical protein
LSQSLKVRGRKEILLCSVVVIVNAGNIFMEIETIDIGLSTTEVGYRGIQKWVAKVGHCDH